MKPESWQQLDQLFQSALELKPEARAVFLDEACVGDESLRKEVEARLAAHVKAGSSASDQPLRSRHSRGK